MGTQIERMKRLFEHFLYSHTDVAQFLRFATVGLKVSIIDLGGVYLLPWLMSVDLYLARLISLSSAILAGYLLNRYFTFGYHQRGGFYRQMAGHFGVHLTGGVINYGVFSAVVAAGTVYLGLHPLSWLLPLVAVWLGGMVGMLFNFTVSRRWVFADRPRDSKVVP